jgi:molybdopterin/thiamine biosynthesis adenylyltransferase
MEMIDHTRHIGIFNVSHLRTCLIGAGGIGALTAVTLAKMGVPEISIWDGDSVEDVNIATQFHRQSDVGLNKADAVASMVSRFAGQAAIPFLSRVDANIKLPPVEIYISAVDSIASRQEIWIAIRKTRCENSWYIDARMGAEVYEHFVVNLEYPIWYQMSLIKQSDEDIPDLPCTSKATIYSANIAAGHLGAAVRRIATGTQEPGLLHHNIIDNQISFFDMQE